MSPAKKKAQEGKATDDGDDEGSSGTAEKAEADSSIGPQEKRKMVYKYEEIKRQKRLEANRRSAAASRQRRLDLIDELKKSVSELTETINNLTRENRELRRQLQLPGPVPMAINGYASHLTGAMPAVMNNPTAGIASASGVPSIQLGQAGFFPREMYAAGVGGSLPQNFAQK